MESRPQNPEFRNNPKNIHPCDISHFENSVDPDLGSQLITIHTVFHSACKYMTMLIT